MLIDITRLFNRRQNFVQKSRSENKKKKKKKPDGKNEQN